MVGSGVPVVSGAAVRVLMSVADDVRDLFGIAAELLEPSLLTASWCSDSSRGCRIRRRALMNQLLIWLTIRPVSSASFCFSRSVGYGCFLWRMSQRFKYSVTSLGRLPRRLRLPMLGRYVWWNWGSVMKVVVMKGSCSSSGLVSMASLYKMLSDLGIVLT